MYFKNKILKLFLLFQSIFSLINQVLTEQNCNTIQCKGKLFETIQLRRIFDDSKTFVDMATKYSPEKILESFEELPANISNIQLKEWVKDNFFDVAYELDIVKPDDWVDDPNVVLKQRNEQLLELVTECNKKWLNLVRQYNESKLTEESVSTFIPVKNPFVVPGSRFTEFYYWDSYWVVEGLLASQMIDTAANFIQNFIDIINKLNYMPNGSRTYYINRSQPPFLMKMISAYYDHTSDNKFIFESLRALDREYDFFMKHRSTEINLKGYKHRLNLYKANTEEPRPESYVEDIEFAEIFDDEKKKDFYMNLASAAESGWDFSSRWLNLNELSTKSSERDLTSISINQIIPVDLNALMYYNERQLQKYSCKWATERAEFYTKCFWYGKVARNRFKSMRKILFDNDKKQWSDFNITSGKHTSSTKININYKNQVDVNGKETSPFYLSDLSPLWFLNDDWHTNDVKKHENTKTILQEKLISDEIKQMNDQMMNKLTENVDEILDSLNSDFDISEYLLNDWQELLFKRNGVPMSNIDSQEQWDLPNAWAPYQMFIIETLLRYHEETFSQTSKYKRLAIYLTKKWLQTNYCGFKKHNKFFEKYNVDKLGEPGTGGEYVVQDGFGWTNGVLLWLANKLGPEIELDSNCNSY